MDVDCAELGKGRLSEAKQKKLQVEGRCFFCKAQGHMSYQCLKKRGRTKNAQNLNCSQPISAQTAKIDNDAPICVNVTAATPDRKAVLKGILGMSAEERTQLLNDLILNDQPSC